MRCKMKWHMLCFPYFWIKHSCVCLMNLSVCGHCHDCCEEKNNNQPALWARAGLNVRTLGVERNATNLTEVSGCCCCSLFNVWPEISFFPVINMFHPGKGCWVFFYFFILFFLFQTIYEGIHFLPLEDSMIGMEQINGTYNNSTG